MKKLIGRAVTAGLICGIFISGVLVVWEKVCKSSIFTITTVEVRGAKRTDKTTLTAIYQPFIGENIFTEIGSSALLTDDPWVIKLEMKRILPNKLMVMVEEEQEVITFRRGKDCLTRTERGNDIAGKCDNVRIILQESPLPEEFTEFTKLYKENEFLRHSDVTLKNGFFWVNNDGVRILANYRPGVFINNYNTFQKHIRPRYKSIDSVDVTVENKVYVRGVI